LSVSFEKKVGSKNFMGVKGLYSYLRPYRKSPQCEETFCIGIDVLSLLYKFRGNLQQIEQLLDIYLGKGFTFVAVFDGKSPEAKQEEVSERRKKREEAQKQADELKLYLSSEDSTCLDEKARGLLEKKIKQIEMGEAWYVSKMLLKQFTEFLQKKQIKVYKAREEADDVLIELFKEKKIRAILSTDMDFLVMGVERIWIPADTVEEIILSEVMTSEDVTLQQLQDIAILCRDSISTQRAFSWIRHYGSLDVLVERHRLVSYTKEQLEIFRKSFQLSKSLSELIEN
jgi:5'-3' exonuclease